MRRDHQIKVKQFTLEKAKIKATWRQYSITAAPSLSSLILHTRSLIIIIWYNYNNQIGSSLHYVIRYTAHLCTWNYHNIVNRLYSNIKQKVKRKDTQGLPWWRSGKESACQCRGHGFELWSGKIPLAAEQLSPCTTTTEPVLWSPWATTAEPTCHNYWSLCAWSPCSTTREATAMRSPRTTTKSRPPRHN